MYGVPLINLWDCHTIYVDPSYPEGISYGHFVALHSGWHICFAMTCCFCAYYLAAYPTSTICTNHSCLMEKWFFVSLSLPPLNIKSCGDSWDTSYSTAIWLDSSLWDLTSSIAIGISGYDFSNLSNTANAAWHTLQVSECLYIIPQPDAQVVI